MTHLIFFPFIFCCIFRYRRFGIQHHFQRCNNRWLSSHLCEKHPPQGGSHPRWETEGRRPPGRGERLPSQKFHNSWKLFFKNIFIKYETYILAEVCITKQCIYALLLHCPMLFDKKYLFCLVYSSFSYPDICFMRYHNILILYKYNACKVIF